MSTGRRCGTITRTPIPRAGPRRATCARRRRSGSTRWAWATRRSSSSWRRGWSAWATKCGSRTSSPTSRSGCGCSRSPSRATAERASPARFPDGPCPAVRGHAPGGRAVRVQPPRRRGSPPPVHLRPRAGARPPAGPPARCGVQRGPADPAPRRDAGDRRRSGPLACRGPGGAGASAERGSRGPVRGCGRDGAAVRRGPVRRRGDVGRTAQLAAARRRAPGRARPAGYVVRAGGHAVLTEYLQPRAFAEFVSEVRAGPFQVVAVEYLPDRLWYRVESWFKAVRDWCWVERLFASVPVARLLGRLARLFGRRGARHICVVARPAVTD